MFYFYDIKEKEMIAIYYSKENIHRKGNYRRIIYRTLNAHEMDRKNYYSLKYNGILYGQLVYKLYRNKVKFYVDRNTMQPTGDQYRFLDMMHYMVHRRKEEGKNGFFFEKPKKEDEYE